MSPRIVRRLRPLSVGIAALLLAPSAARPQAPSIPLITGLTITLAVSEPRGDYEVTESVVDVKPDVMQLEMSALVPVPGKPDSPQPLTVTRIVRRSDMTSSHKWTSDFATDDPSIFPGALADGFSTAMLNEVASTGATSIVLGTFDNLESFLPGPLGALRNYYRGDLHRVEPGIVPLPVIVNGARVSLPTIHVRGHLTVAANAMDADIYILNDPVHPLALKGGRAGSHGQVIEIDWAPFTRGTADSGGGMRGRMADGLSGKNCRTEVYGIHFAFNSATVLPQSDAALSQVAGVLKANPTWNVTIEGHTDSIGGHASNLDLSKRRAAAVSVALTGKYGIPAGRLSTTGFGDSRPIESNATLEGRARNRRVEMSRKC